MSKVLELSERDIQKIADAVLHSETFKEHLDCMEKAVKDLMLSRLEWAVEKQAKYDLINRIIEMDYESKLKGVEE